MPELANPTIALGIKTAEPGQTSVANPLALMGTVAQTQSALANARRANIEATTAQQALGARERIGQIMATAPNFEAGVKAVQMDPSVAGFAPDVLSSLASVDQTFTTIAGQKQSQSLNALGSVYKALSMGLEDPSMVQPALDAASTTMPPEIAAKIMPGVDKMLKGLTYGLDNTPEGRAEYRKRLVSAAVGSGAVSSDEAYKLTGTVPPSITMQPVGQGGALEPMMTGGAPGAEPMAKIVDGQEQPAVPSTTPRAVTNTPADSTGISPDGVIQPPHGLSASEEARLKGLGHVEANLVDETNKDSQVYPELLKWHKVADAMQQAKFGGGASLRTSFGVFMQALQHAGVPIDQKDIDAVSNSSLSGSELFQKEIQPAMMDAMRVALKGTGQVRTPELDVFLKNLSSDTDPNTMVTMLNQKFQEIAQQYDYGTKFHAFAKMVQNKDPKVAGWTIAEYPAWYMSPQHMNEKYVQDMLKAAPGGLSMSGVNPASVPGTVQYEAKPPAKPGIAGRRPLGSFLK